MMTAIWIIVILLAVPAIIALFVPKEYVIERTVFIDRQKHEVFDYVKNIRNQDHYSKWPQTDPDMKKTFTGTDGTIGFIYAWNGNSKAGEGEHEITGITDGERITTEIRFVRPFKNVAHTYMTTEADTEHSTKLTWGMIGKSAYPMNLMTAMLKGTLGNDMAVSLNKLKNILEGR